MTPEQVSHGGSFASRGDSAFAAGAARLAGLTPRLLGWRPDDFWCATPAELAAILAPDTDPADADPLSRAEFDRLMEQDRDG